MTDRPAEPLPTTEERRRAVCDAMAIAPRLVRFAARYTRSVDDAEDAYQRAMEIALTRSPTAERDRFMAWLYVVLRNEAIATTRSHGREMPTSAEDLALAAGPTSDPGPESRAEWRERYLAVNDALSRLTEAQRICLMLQSAGASYSSIAEMTGFSSRKIERSVLEGRLRLRDWEVRITEGNGCAALEEAIGRVARGEAGRGDRRQVSRHTRHCRACRVLLASRRDTAHWMGSLVPVALLGGGLAETTPDPGVYLAAFDRAAAGVTIRAGQTLQLLMELPGSGVAKTGAAAGAVVLALWAAVPMVTSDDEGRRAAEVAPMQAVRPSPSATASIVERVLAARAPADRPPASAPGTTASARRAAASGTTARPPARAEGTRTGVDAAEPSPVRSPSAHRSSPRIAAATEPATSTSDSAGAMTDTARPPGAATPDSLDPGSGHGSAELPAPSGDAIAMSIGP